MAGLGGIRNAASQSKNPEFGRSANFDPANTYYAAKCGISRRNWVEEKGGGST